MKVNEFDDENQLKKNENFLEVQMMFYGKTSSSQISGVWFDHARNLSLTFDDELTMIEANSFHDELLSLKFVYGENKSIVHNLRNYSRRNPVNRSDKCYFDQPIDTLTQCYKAGVPSAYLVGLLVGFQNESTTLFGSCLEQETIREIPSQATIVYVSVRLDNYLRALQFVWRKRCAIDGNVFVCMGDDYYALSLEMFYND